MLQTYLRDELDEREVTTATTFEGCLTATLGGREFVIEIKAFDITEG